MQAEALEVVQKIVAAGDAGEEVVDLCRTLVAGRVKFIAHAAQSSDEGGAGQTREIALRAAAALLVSPAKACNWKPINVKLIL